DLAGDRGRHACDYGDHRRVFLNHGSGSGRTSTERVIPMGRQISNAAAAHAEHQAEQQRRTAFHQPEKKVQHHQMAIGSTIGYPTAPHDGTPWDLPAKTGPTTRTRAATASGPARTARTRASCPATCNQHGATDQGRS